MPEWKSVYSSSVDAVSYDPDTQTLLVRWMKGKLSAYEGVPPEVGESLHNAPSVGQALRLSVIGQYAHGYVDEE